MNMQMATSNDQEIDQMQVSNQMEWVVSANKCLTKVTPLKMPKWKKGLRNSCQKDILNQQHKSKTEWLRGIRKTYQMHNQIKMYHHLSNQRTMIIC